MILPATKKFVDHAISQMLDGNAIVYPTDTIYGFGADATNKEAINKINTMKQRNAPLSIMVNSIDRIHRFGCINNEQLNILNTYLPGPFTFLLHKKKSPLSDLISAGSEKIGIRIPNHPFCSQLTTALGPIVTTSVNLHKENPINDPVVINNKFNNVFIYSDGSIERGISSTIVDISESEINILRQGEGTI